MPFKDRDAQRQYQLEWMWRRRLMWILDHGPCRWCGSVNELQVTWKNPATKKMRVSSIWSRSDDNRARLLADCEVLCSTCAKKKVTIWRVIKAAMSKEDE